MQYNQLNISTNNDIAIEVNNVRKRYRLFKSRNDRLKEAVSLGRKKYHKEFWALDGISFSIINGETIGILGRNGSGKSTLLQILASVMKETTGEVVVNGKVAALLELGAGFKQEFTGRDNVILSGVIQGIPEKEMLCKLDDVRSFADIGEFFDQPVGIYSSGMFVRLAFSAAINVDPDILIIDEALAVGDAKFQTKCFQKLKELKDQGVTIIFVSHDTNIVMNLADRVIVMDGGKIIAFDSVKKAIDRYDSILFGGNDKQKIKYPNDSRVVKIEPDNSDSNSIKKEFLESKCSRQSFQHRKNINPEHVLLGDKRANLVDILIFSNGVLNPPVFNKGDVIDIYAKYHFREQVDNPVFGFGLRTIDGTRVCGVNTEMLNIQQNPTHSDSYIIWKCSLKLSLLEGDYPLNIGVSALESGDLEFIDVRRGLMILKIINASKCDGVADLDVSIKPLLI